jgi:hypothetical protein
MLIKHIVGDLHILDAFDLSISDRIELLLNKIPNFDKIIKRTIDVESLHGTTILDSDNMVIEYKPSPYYETDKIYIQLQFLDSEMLTYTVDIHITNSIEKPQPPIIDESTEEDTDNTDSSTEEDTDNTDSSTDETGNSDNTDSSTEEDTDNTDSSTEEDTDTTDTPVVLPPPNMDELESPYGYTEEDIDNVILPIASSDVEILKYQKLLYKLYNIAYNEQEIKVVIEALQQINTTLQQLNNTIYEVYSGDPDAIYSVLAPDSTPEPSTVRSENLVSLQERIKMTTDLFAGISTGIADEDTLKAKIDSGTGNHTGTPLIEIERAIKALVLSFIHSDLKSDIRMAELKKEEYPENIDDLFWEDLKAAYGKFAGDFTRNINEFDPDDVDNHVYGSSLNITDGGQL